MYLLCQGFNIEQLQILYSLSLLLQPKFSVVLSAVLIML